MPYHLTRDQLDDALSLMKPHALTEGQTRAVLNLVTERARTRGFDVEQDTKRIIADLVARG